MYASQRFFDRFAATDLLHGLLPVEFTGLLWVKYAVVLIGILWVSRSVFLHSFKARSRLPPGPRGWPLIGNIFDLGKLPHRDLHQLFEKHGPIVRLKLGSFDMIATGDPDITKEVLVTQDDVFASRPQSIAIKYLSFNSQNMSFAPYGNHWRVLRRICMENLLTHKRLQSFRPHRQEEARFMVSSINKESKEGRSIRVKEQLATFSMNSTTRMLLGKRYFGTASAGAADSSEFRSLVAETMKLMGEFNIGDFFPALTFLDFLRGKVRQMKSIATRTSEFFSQIIEEREERRKAGKFDDVPNFVDVILSIRDSGGQEFNKTVIEGLLEDMIVGSADTLPIANEWAMAELLRHPKVLKKAQEEIDSVVGKELEVEEEDLNQLHYLRCIVMETLRLRPPGAFNLPHMSMKATKLAGYDIPANTQILISAFTHARSRKLWGDNAEEFEPERHIHETIKTENNPGADVKYMSFSAGKRRCPGAQLGMIVMMFALARLIHSFDWSLPAGVTVQDIDMTEAYGLTTPMRTPLIAVATPRLATHLYS
eukprot:c28894_g1_i1 orf=478-2094(+)